MKVIHIESGLGNQMLSYCEYLAMKKANPMDDVYLENIIYDIPECNDVICQWNGYELERIFGIKTPNIKDCFSEEQWRQVMVDIRSSQFWLHNWNYPVHFTNAFARAGLKLKNIRGDFEHSKAHVGYDCNRKPSFKDKLRSKDWYLYLRYIKNQTKDFMNNDNYEPKLFIHSDENLFTGQLLLFKYKNSGIEKIADEIKSAFKFPEITDRNNLDAVEKIKSCDSVAIHARRGDMLGVNYPYYRFGYFKRAVKYMKQRIVNPVFFIFCDSGSVSWVKENKEIFGLDSRVDKIYFIDWNKKYESYRDMQLMALCKHQIITSSTFGWWGAWLNANPDRITISPRISINTTNHFI